ncbi:hypothetical protein BZZ01_21220 [Nostocales cyanobacterium HT-58-2]|nr:hypothetical protein BZZ01_21220 [Nostocales cyanobacterium HT-58-2]
MWQKEKKDSSILNLPLLLALVTTPLAGTLVVSSSTVAQSTGRVPSFPLLEKVSSGAKVRIDSSARISAINRTLKQSFEEKFSDTKVEVATTGTDAALKSILDQKTDKTTSESQPLVSTTNNSGNTSTTATRQTQLWWWLLPLLTLGGLLPVWWVKKRSSVKGQPTQKVKELNPTPLTETSSPGTTKTDCGVDSSQPTSNQVEEETKPTSNQAISTSSAISHLTESNTAGDGALAESDILTSNVQLQTYSPYPPLPDIWEEVEADYKAQAQTTNVTVSYPPLPDVWEEIASDQELRAFEQQEVGEVTSSSLDNRQFQHNDIPAVPTPLASAKDLLGVESRNYEHFEELNITSYLQPPMQVVDISFSEVVFSVERDQQPKATEVKVVYPQLPDVWEEVASDMANVNTSSAKVVSNVKQQSTAVSAFYPQLPFAKVASNVQDAEDIALDLEAPAAVVTPLYPKIPEISAHGQTETAQDEILDLTDILFELVANEDEPIEETPQVETEFKTQTTNEPEQNFWFVADAELIIHGATKPGATVTIGDRPIKLEPDGTFQLRIPFTQSLIDYVMTAVDADGEHTRTIHKKFISETSQEDS